MAEQTIFDQLNTNVDSYETKILNAIAVTSFRAQGTDGTIIFDSTQQTIPGILDTTASFASTASHVTPLSQNVSIAGNLTVNGTAYLNSVVSVTSSYSSGSTIFGDALSDTHQFTGSVYITNSLSLTGSFKQIGDYIHTGSVYHSGSKFLVGIFSQTGSMNITGSTTQIGNNNLLGNTTLSGSIIISGALSQPNPTISIFGDLNQTGYTRYLPVTTNLDTSISASYIFVSGSTQDLYFSQNGKGYNNITRLRWLEGNLYTGIFNGGLITTQSSTVYQVGSGSGVIVNLNASYNDNPYPTVQYVNWNDLSASIAPLSASFDQSFVAINSSATINVQENPYDNGQYNTLIPIGIVLHQNNSTINGVQTFPSVAYGWKQRSFDFIKAFGPLKISGYTLSPSSSLGLLLSGGVSWVDGRNYTIDPNNPSYITEATGITTSKIFRYYQSGSEFVYDTNGGVGYTTIDPTQYSLNGTLTAVPGTGANRKWSIQRVYYFPNSATKAFFIYYGNDIYDTREAAIAGILTEVDLEAPNTAANAIYIGALVLRNNATFTDATSYAIQAGGLFRQSGVGGGSGGGGGTTNPGGLTTQIQYNNGGIFDGVSTLVYDGTTLSATGSFSGSFSGSLAGTASWATTASKIFISNLASDPGTYYPMFAGNTYGAVNLFADALTYTYQPSTNILTVTASLALGVSASSINSNTFETYDSSNNPSINWDVRRLQDSSGNISTSWEDRILANNASTTTVDWQTGVLNDSTGATSIDWERRRLKDTLDNISADYEDRRLIANDGATISLDWTTPGSTVISGGLNISGSLTLNNSNISTAWTSYIPVWTAASVNPVINNGTIEGWYKLVGKTCFVRGNIAMGSTTTFGSGEWYVSMPFTASHADAILMTANLLDNTTAWYNAVVNGARAGFNYKAPLQYQAVGGTANDVNATQPFTWASSDRFIWNGSFEIA